ncbi:hypothetical protein DFH07DRAFT_338335 [Mycena maculata]|uniref:Uncharacterized protein n=1 Tax=Mycena maculata TaxID=230809 RepID=A0AAD7MIQ0_9AGAR|nr:hypothetical protein DFH07DRAFT_338335 [Mycena maculata]
MHILADTSSPVPQSGVPRILHIVRDCRGDVLGELDSPCVPAGLYPEVLLQMAACLNDEHASSPYQFYDLWELILLHWFPEREGYSITHQWPIPYLEDRDGAGDVTFAVLDRDHPVVLLQVSAPRGFDNPHTRAAAEALSASHFEHAAPYCPGDQPLCAVAALGKKWTAFQATSASLTAHEARALGEESIEWMDDIVSEPSYEMLERFFSVLKERSTSVILPVGLR